MFVCLMILSGCKDIDDHYSSIEETFISDIMDDENKEYLKFKGHSDNWAVVYIAHREKGADRYATELITKYIGKKPYPTGEIRFDYDAGSEVNSGGVSIEDEPENGIYYLDKSGSSELMPLKTTKVKLQIGWNEKSEFIELESE